MLRRTLGGEAEFPEAVSSGLSASCMDMLHRMLLPDPAQRITMSQLLSHPFFLEVRAAIGLQGKRMQAGLCTWKSRDMGCCQRTASCTTLFTLTYGSLMYKPWQKAWKLYIKDSGQVRCA